MDRWDNAQPRVRFGPSTGSGQAPSTGSGQAERPASTDTWALPMVAFALVALLVTVGLQRMTEPRDVLLTEVPAEIARLSPGETLWDLASHYAPDQDPRAWIERVKEVNGWTEIPLLRPGQPFIVTSWAHPGRRPPEGEPR